MEKEIQKRCPYKIDIGAVFSQKVWMRFLARGASWGMLQRKMNAF
jgi:hypothetical protein